MKTLPSRVFLFRCFLVLTFATVSYAEPRTWTATDGRSIQAEFIGATDSAVKIRMTNREEVEIPLTRLSEADRKWVAEAKAKAEAPKPIEGEYAKLITDDWALSTDGDLPFAFFGSKEFSADKKYPLVVSLHGKSDNSENGKQIGFARKFASPANFKQRPCFVVAPLCYQPYGATGGGWSDKPGEEVLELIEKLVEGLPIDEERIYMIGYSMGGFGTCHLMAQEPDLIAAGVAVAGYGHNTGDLKREPLWLFHAADDPVVKVDGSRTMADDLKRSKTFKYTEWETGGHGIAGKVTDDPEVHKWLFQQKNG